MRDLSCVVITGLSGAGKSEAVRAFEDLGYFCIDNLPVILIPKLAELLSETSGRIDKVALVIDVRGQEFFGQLTSVIRNLEDSGFAYRVVFLEASDETLVKRFKESRRPHPLSTQGTILDGIDRERRLLAELRTHSTEVIDTTGFTTRQLRAEIVRRFGDGPSSASLGITFVSFGFKHGIPGDADMVLDVRFLPNPFYMESLRDLTGSSDEVTEYVLRWPVTKRLLDRLFDLFRFLIPEYAKEGKANLIVGIGCTGGKHRSVVVANALADYVRELGYRVCTVHRDIGIMARDVLDDAGIER
ncbi:MAG: RNase adapter RapZ [Clostridia bacterium]|nr:RNase adapter RapZ [Clostridia bacterium]